MFRSALPLGPAKNVSLGFAAWPRQECLTFIACKDKVFSLNHQINI